MNYIGATFDMADDIQNVLHTAIETIYPKYYPKEVVDFFCRHHSKENILNGIVSGNMGVLVYNDAIVGTGCFDDNHITGVYVLPAYQNQGCGSYIMNCLEKEISKTYDTVILDASLLAACLYEHRGYKTVGHGIYELENDVKQKIWRLRFQIKKYKIIFVMVCLILTLSRMEKSLFLLCFPQMKTKPLLLLLW